MNKRCPKCDNVKPVEYFYKNRARKDGFDTYCKACSLAYKQTTQKENIAKSQKKCNQSPQRKDYIAKYRSDNKEKLSLYKKEWKNKNKENIREKDKFYRLNNKKALYEYNKKYALKNRDKMNKWKKEWRRNEYKNNSNYRIAMCLRSRIKNAINNQGSSKNVSALDYLGCSVSDVRNHLEAMFYSREKTAEKMTWDNYGLKGWHIDHIKPCASFDLTDPEQQKECFHYTNLQPLWAEDNLAKSDKLNWTKEN